MLFKEERHFALIGGAAFSSRRLAVIVFQVKNSVRPMHLFGHTCDHDYYFELPAKESKTPNRNANWNLSAKIEDRRSVAIAVLVTGSQSLASHANDYRERSATPVRQR
jgi:hypothetical protein